MADKIYVYELAKPGDMTALKEVLKSLAYAWLGAGSSAGVSTEGFISMQSRGVSGNVPADEVAARRAGEEALKKLLELAGRLKDAPKALIRSVFMGVRYVSARPPVDAGGVWRLLYWPYIRARTGEEALPLADERAYVALEVGGGGGRVVSLEVHLRPVVRQRLVAANQTPNDLPILKNRYGLSFIAYRFYNNASVYLPHYLIINKGHLLSEYRFLPAYMMIPPSLSSAITIDLGSFAKSIGVEKEVLMALEEQESRGSGFDDAGRPTILFEPNHFYNFLKGKYSPTLIEDYKNKYRNINLINEKNLPNSGLTKTQYFGSRKLQYEKLEIATLIDEDAGIKATSWGKYQILGEFYQTCGFTSARSFKEAMYTIEGQLEAFMGYCRANKLLVRGLQEKNWEKIAEGYNGKNWRSFNPNYASNIRKYYEEFKR